MFTKVNLNPAQRWFLLLAEKLETVSHSRLVTHTSSVSTSFFLFLFADGAQQMSFLSALFIGSQSGPSSDPQRYLQLCRKTPPSSSNSVYTHVIKANEKRPEGFFPSFALMYEFVRTFTRFFFPSLRRHPKFVP